MRDSGVLRRGAVALASMILFASMAACSTSAPIAQKAFVAREGGSTQNAGYPNWDDPTQATRVQNYDEAGSLVTFPVREPRGLGSPTDIYILPPVKDTLSTLDLRSITAKYHSEPYGDFRVLMKRSGLTDLAAWSQFVTGMAQQTQRQTDPRNAKGEVIQLKKDGASAEALLLIAPDGHGVIQWREGIVEWSVTGTPDLDRNELIALAQGA